MIETQTVTGRTPVAWWKKINPIWWFLNNDEPLPKTGLASYYPGRPYWLAVISWYIRNPLVNFSDYVVGVCDRNYVIYGSAPVMTVILSDIGKTGWHWSVIKLGILRLPFVSYAGKRIAFYAGWQPAGCLAFKFNILNSPVQAV